MVADDPRANSQWFRFLELEAGGSEAFYECPRCKKRIKSQLIPAETPPSAQ